MKLDQLAREINITSRTLEKFVEDFELVASKCFSSEWEVKDEFEVFARENSDFLKTYEDDLDQEKSLDDLAAIINRPKNKVKQLLEEYQPNIYENGVFRSSISSFAVDKAMGGNYGFVYDYFGQKQSLQQRDFIGYRDLYYYINNVLEPFHNEQQVKDWGIEKPAGIVLYGPPGSGKIFWSNKIAEIINYQFKEVKKYYLGVSYVDGKKTFFNDFLVKMLKEDRVLMFVDDFDKVMDNVEDDHYCEEDEETKDIILHNINRFSEENLLMVGAANSVSTIDKEILAPGRFDVLIPVFPPNASERAEIILFSMLKGLTKDALLYKILQYNKADQLPFWRSIAEQMKVFSNTMVIDFTQSLKKRIKNLYQKRNTTQLVLSEGLISGALRDASTKLTQEYLEQVAQFVQDVTINNVEDFLPRIVGLQNELQSYMVVEEPRRVIGFHRSDEEDQGIEESTQHHHRAEEEDEL